MRWKSRVLLPPTLLTLSLISSACAIKVETTVFTDCAWFRDPPKLSAANKAHFNRAPDPANAGAFFDVVRDNKKKRVEFCPSPSG